MGGITIIDVNYDQQWIEEALAEVQRFSWLFDWGIFIFILAALFILLWIFYDSVNKGKGPQSVVPRVFAMLGLFCIIPSFIFRFTGNANGITHMVRMTAELGQPLYNGPINWNVHLLVMRVGPIFAILALFGMVLSIVGIVIYASTLHRSRPSTEFVRAFNNRIGNLENQVNESQRNMSGMQPMQNASGGGNGFQNPSPGSNQYPNPNQYPSPNQYPAPNGQGVSIADGWRVDGSMRSRGAATVVDRAPQAATVIDVPRSGATLTEQTGNGRGHVYDLPTHDITVGRSETNFITVDDCRVSRTHLKIIYANGAWFALDAGSANGTTLNGNRLMGQQPLNNGDQITLGSTVLVFGLGA